MIGGFSDEWQSLCQDFSKFSEEISRVSTVNVNSSKLRAEAVRIAQRYLGLVRPALIESGLDDGAAF
jgi:hypothetical protein